MYILIAAALAISLFITAAPAQKVSANPGLSEWDMVSTPTVQGWVLAPESEIVDFAVGANGTVAYSIVYTNYFLDHPDCVECVGCNPDEPEGPYYLLKSTDSAATWKSITKGIKTEIDKKSLGNITELEAVACDADNPDFVAVALTVLNYTVSPLHVFISNDGGSTFRDTGEVGLDEAYDLEVSPAVDNVHDIAIGGYAGSDGKIFRNQAIGGIGTGWEDTSLSLYPGWQSCSWVEDIQFSPSWSEDHGILAVTGYYDGDYDVYLQTGIWGDTEAWNFDAISIDAVPIVTDVLNVDYETAGITLPTDYKATDKDKRCVWVWVNYYDGVDWVGVIFRVEYTSASAISVEPIGMQINGNPELANVSYLGTIASGKAIVGLLYGEEECCAGVQVYRKSDITDMDTCPSCLPWEPACKPPTGVHDMVAFFVSPTKAYAVALWNDDGYGGPYDEGAWSVSWEDDPTDVGEVWNQLSLIDTRIDYLSDVAVSPDCNKMWLVSIFDEGEDGERQYCVGCDSVWLKATDLPEAAEYSGKWLRTWTGRLLGERAGEGKGKEWGLLRLPPDGMTGNLTADEIAGETVYLVDYGTTTVYWDTVETLGCWDHCSASKLLDIVDLAVKDASTTYALASDGKVAMSDEYACNWHTPVDSLVCGYTIAVNGDYVLVGGRNGDVSYSDDGGATFTLLEDVGDDGDLVTVAFDSYFDDNNVIYAALAKDTNPTTGGIYRWVIDESENWTDLQAWHGVVYTGLVLSNADGNPFTTAETGGVLYASYIGWDGECGKTGVARCLTPAAEISCEQCVEWDYLDESNPDDLFYNCGGDFMDFEAWPDALKICGCLSPDSNAKLFALDDGWDYDMCKGEDGTVWTFEDCYAKKAPSLKSPADGFSAPAGCAYCENLPFTLKWDAVCDACDYDIQIAMDEDFTELVGYDVGEEYGGPDVLRTTGLAYVVTGGLTSEVTYYWRVRAHEAGTGQRIHSWWSDVRSVTVAPAGGAGVNLVTPEAGATDVVRTKLAFTWSKVASATKYEWVLSKNADLSSPVESQSGLTKTAYTCTKTLEYDTPYYWQVTAYKGDAAISASTIGTFRTVAETVPVTPVTAPTPFWVWVVIAIGAVLVIVVIVLIFRTRRV
jgi:hypothetical protein